MRRWFVLLSVVALAGCQTDGANVKNEVAALSLSPDSLAQHQNELRRFDTNDETFVLSAASGVMQDLGFTIEETSAKAGLIVASKDRDAVETGQVASAIMMAALISALGGKADPVWEKNQKIRLSLATRRAADGNGTVVRVTFQRVIWNTKNQISRVESINDPVIYQQFFDKLSQSLFLEAHQI
jgi:hypothetical protein